MTQPFVSRSSDPDMQAVPIALMRAAQRARELARQTGTRLVVMHDGRLVELDPERVTWRMRERRIASSGVLI